MPHSTAALVAIALFLAGAPAVIAAPPAVPGPTAWAITAPHVLPSGQIHIARRQARTWLIGAKPGARTDGIAARHGAKRVSHRGTFVVARDAARGLARALRTRGLYRFAEPDRLLARAQAPPGGDDVAATDWRPVIRPPAALPSLANGP